MSTHFKPVFMRAAITMAVAAAVSDPCAAQYGVNNVPPGWIEAILAGQVRQFSVLSAEHDELQHQLFRLCSNKQHGANVVPSAPEFCAHVLRAPRRSGDEHAE
jgi:hypothetical protein